MPDLKLVIKKNMAGEIVKKDSVKEGNLVPGYFTGNYTSSSRGLPNTTQLQKLSTAAISFTNELQKALQQNPMALKTAMMQPVKVQNVPNSLPLLGSVTQRIGIEGALLSLRPILYYCQFSKKISPQARFM